MLSALRSLQEKMQKLEFERREAESNLQTLASETETYKTSLHHSQHHNVDNFRPARQDVGMGETGPSTSSSGNTRTQPRGEYCDWEDLDGWPSDIVQKGSKGNSPKFQCRTMKCRKSGEYFNTTIF